MGRSPGEGNGNPLQYHCLENPMDGGAWKATAHGVAKSWTRLSDFTSLLHDKNNTLSLSTLHTRPTPSQKGRQLCCAYPPASSLFPRGSLPSGMRSSVWVQVRGSLHMQASLYGLPAASRLSQAPSSHSLFLAHLSALPVPALMGDECISMLEPRRNRTSKYICS